MTETQAFEKSIGFDPGEPQVFHQLWRTYDLFKTIEDRFLSRFGLTPQLYNAVPILKAASPNAKQTMQLGQRMRSRGPDMTRMLDRVEAKNLISRDQQNLHSKPI